MVGHYNVKSKMADGSKLVLQAGVLDVQNQDIQVSQGMKCGKGQNPNKLRCQLWQTRIFRLARGSSMEKQKIQIS